MSLYPEPTNIWESIEYSSLGITVAESTWMFPTIETIHVIALVTVLGMIAIVDLRLIGVSSRALAVTKLSKDTLPWVWGAFILAALTGGLLFVSKATSYVANPYFLWKMGLMLLAGVNMFIFHRVVAKGMGTWGQPGGQIPTAAKVSGLVSLALWMVIPLCGRIVGFTLGVYYA